MKTKKHSIMISSTLSELILQSRNSTYQQSYKKIQQYQKRINEMNQSNLYSKQLYIELIDKHQYGIEQKLNSKENKLIKNCTVLIHFKLTEKLTSNISFIESWLLSTEKHNVSLKASQIDCNQELIYLLQEVLQSLRCQFLSDFLSMDQQFRSRYILDYEVEVNPTKKSLRKLHPLHYEQIWKKEAFLDEYSKMTVTCYHNTLKKLQSIISLQKQWSRSKSIKPHNHVKHGSQQTKPSNSGQYELSTSIQEKGGAFHSRQRKTSMIQFYDEDLNITVLSSDSDTFKKSTGRIEGVYTEKDLKNVEGHEDSDDQFQLLIEESVLEEMEKDNKAQKEHARIREIEKQLEGLLFKLDQTVEKYLL